MSVTIYTTKTCQFCKMAKAYFKEHKIAFKEVDVSEDTDRQKEMIKLSGQMGVPVIAIKKGKEETVQVGFDKEKFDKMFTS